MGRFFISMLLALAGLIALIFTIRMDLKLLSAADRYFTSKYKRISRGFEWGVKLPTLLGRKIEYYFFIILGKKHYCNYSSWPVKISILISLFLFLGILFSNSFTQAYYSFQFREEIGFTSYFVGKPILYYLHIVNLAYLTLIVAILIDSSRMTGISFPIRSSIVISSVVLSIFITILSSSFLIAGMVIYLIFKILLLLLRNKIRDPYKEREPSYFARNYYSFLEVREQFHYDDIVNDTYEEEEITSSEDNEWKSTDDEFKRVFKD